MDDAENKQTKNEAMNTWLRDLRDWAYDEDDLLDELATGSKLKTAADVAYTNMTTSSSIAGFISKEVRALSSYMDVIFIGYIHRAAAKMDEICARSDQFYAQKARLGLEVGVYNTGERTHATSLYFHPNIYGRADVEKRIINLLLGIGTGQGSSGANKLDVVVIAGMEGIGKKTLAHPIFNNASKDMNLVLSSSLRELKVRNFEKLGKEKKKIMLVLDDVWFTGCEYWESLRAPFEAAAAGSKVIVTTQHEAVALVMWAVKRFTLEELSDADRLSVFQQHAFENDSSISYPEVVPFHLKILKKCKGF